MKTAKITSRTPFLLDGHKIQGKNSLKFAKVVHTVIVGPDRIIRSFSDDHLFIKWVSSSPLAKTYEQGMDRFRACQSILARNDGDKVQRILGSVQQHFDKASDAFDRLDRILSWRDKLRLTKAMSPRAGTVVFYKDAGFRNSFDNLNGFFHWSSRWVGKKNNDKLTAIKIYIGAWVVACEHKDWGGRRVHFAGFPSFEISDLTTTPLYWFNDMMSSYFFIA